VVLGLMARGAHPDCASPVPGPGACRRLRYVSPPRSVACVSGVVGAVLMKAAFGWQQDANDVCGLFAFIFLCCLGQVRLRAEPVVVGLLQPAPARELVLAGDNVLMPFEQR